ncbi:hypothetical protein ACVWZF_002698 [Thermostichus sp. OS-CIW-30]|jgi:hypothetical protein
MLPVVVGLVLIGVEQVNPQIQDLVHGTTRVAVEEKTL